MNKNNLYLLADRYLKDKRFFLPEFGGSIPQSRLRAKPTGEFRCPKQDEWYLSGAIPEAYKAPNDLSTEFYIVEIVLTSTVTVETITEHLP